MSSKDAQIARIDEVSKVARTSWFGLLAYLAFVGVTLLGVEDADFFIVERQTRLPLMGGDIPTAAFFRYAPILGAALHIYLHLQLLKLWEALAEPPMTARHRKSWRPGTAPAFWRRRLLRLNFSIPPLRRMICCSACSTKMACGCTQPKRSKIHADAQQSGLKGYCAQSRMMNWLTSKPMRVSFRSLANSATGNTTTTMVPSPR